MRLWIAFDTNPVSFDVVPGNLGIVQRIATMYKVRETFDLGFGESPTPYDREHSFQQIEVGLQSSLNLLEPPFEHRWAQESAFLNDESGAAQVCAATDDPVSRSIALQRVHTQITSGGHPASGSRLQLVAVAQFVYGVGAHPAFAAFQQAKTLTHEGFTCRVLDGLNHIIVDAHSRYSTAPCVKGDRFVTLRA